MDPGRGAPTVPRLLVATVQLLAASALFGWGYVVGRQAPATPVERGSAQLAPAAPSPSSADLEAQKAAFDREMARLVQSQKEVTRLRTLFEEEKARIVRERVRLAVPRASPPPAPTTTAAQSSMIRLLAMAADRLMAQDYDNAITVYDEALKLDPTNIAAQTGKAGAVSARAIQNAAAGRFSAPVRSFQAGTTSATSVESRAGAAPEGFEISPGVSVKKGTTAAELPGKIRFEFTPEAPKAGERYRVAVSLMNEGAAPIGIASVLTTTTINGKKLQGPVPPLTREAAPHQTAPVFEVMENWKDETTSWRMEVVVRAIGGETYRNTLVWR